MHKEQNEASATETLKKMIEKRGGKQTPVDDLIIEDSREDLKAEGAKVIHPIAFMLPNAFLKILSRL